MVRRQKIVYPCRVEGWLLISDKCTGSRRAGSRVEPRWEPHFCVLLQDEQTLTAYKSEELSISDSLFVELPRVRLDGGGRALRHWDGPPCLPEEPEDEEALDTVSLRGADCPRQPNSPLAPKLRRMVSLSPGIVAHSEHRHTFDVERNHIRVPKDPLDFNSESPPGIPVVVDHRSVPTHKRKPYRKPTKHNHDSFYNHSRCICATNVCHCLPTSKTSTSSATTSSANRKRTLSRPLEISRQVSLAGTESTPKPNPGKLASGLNFIRRTHSTKLTRSPSILKTLTTKCVLDTECDSSNDLNTSYTAVHGTPNNKTSASAAIMTRPSPIDDEDQGIHSDTSYEKACRRGSAPNTPVLGSKNNTLDITPSRIVNFFSKRSFRSNPLKRTKSVTKLERGKRPYQNGVDENCRLRTSRSHESLLSGHSVMTTLDLGSSPGSVEIKALHPSVLGRQHCFQVTLSSDQDNPRYFSCRSQDERDKWVYSLRKSVQPDVEHTRRTDNSLKLWILEAKGIANKKRYFCEVKLDQTLYARTSTKLKNELCFWGEHFDFHNLPSVNVLNIMLYREGERKKRKDKNALVGQVQIPIHEVTSRYLTEKWFPISIDKHKEAASLRIKCRFQSIEILPVKVYSEFMDYLKNDYKKVCEILEPVIGVKAKEDIATALVLAMQSEGLARPFLADIVMMDILRVDDQRLTFRGNSLATKAMEAYLKLTGDRYLQETLGELVEVILSSDADCEVDPQKVQSIAALDKQQQNLRSTCGMAWSKILQSHKNFPPELRECFASFRERLASLDKEDISDNLISASIFLRFLCPAILSPSLFNITHEYPNEKAARNLTLVAKTLQTLANFTRFQGKENFMEFMNDFLEKEATHMKDFLYNISTRSQENGMASRRESLNTQLEFDGYIDLGKQLSILSTLLTECLSKVASGKLQELDPLVKILEQLRVQHCTSHQYLRQHSSPPTVNCIDTSNNIFRYNDPTVQNNNPAPHPHPLQLSASASNISNNNPLISPIVHSSQSYLNNSIQINLDTTLDNLATMARHTATALQNNKINVNCNTLNYDNHKKSPRLGVRAATLPRNTYGSPPLNLVGAQNGEDFVIEPANAFVTKSPTPILKNLNRRAQQNIHERAKSRCGQDMNQQQTNCQGSPNLDEISDLLTYADEEAHNNKGSNVSISQLSNVASSGYQSFAYSQSSSPVDLTINNNPNGLKYESTHNSTKYIMPDKNKVNRNDSFETQQTKYLQSNGTKYIQSNNKQALAFANPVYSMDFTPKRQLETSSSDENLNQSEVKNITIDEDLKDRNYMDDMTSPIVRRINNGPLPRTNPLLGYRSDKKNGGYLLSKNHEYTHDNSSNWLSGSQQSLSKPDPYESRLYLKPCLAEPQYEFEPAAFNNHGHLDVSKSYYDERYDGKSNIARDKHYRRLSLESARDLSDSSSEAEETTHQYHTTGRHRRSRNTLDYHLEKPMENTRQRLERLDLEANNVEDSITAAEGESKMRSIISRLITAEEELRKEQQKMSMALSQKQKVIEAQEHKIAALDATNNRLLTALSTLKQRYHGGDRNGVDASNSSLGVSDPNDNTLLADLCGMKTSSC